MKDRKKSFSSGETPRTYVARLLRIALAGLLLATLAASGGFAQQSTPEPCSPAATESLKSERQLPPASAPSAGRSSAMLANRNRAGLRALFHQKVRQTFC